MSMAQGVTDAAILRRHAPRFLQNLARLAGETTHLAVWDGQRLMFVGRATTETSLVQAHAQYGRFLPAYCTASGKVLLSELRWDEVVKHAAVEGFVQRTPTTITDFETLRDQLAKVYLRGFATNMEEADEGVCAMAVPVRGSDGRVIAALGISTTAGRFNALRARHTQSMIRMAAGLSAAIVNDADLAPRPGVAARELELIG
jgi:DNA-binding IclR family transcriptional regulator